MTASFQHRSPGDLRRLLVRVEHTHVNPVVTAAAEAARTWARTPYAERVQRLQAIEADLRAVREELALGIAVEVGKPLSEARGELGAVLGKFALTFADAEAHYQPQPVAGGVHPAEIRHRARGPAVIIGPFNFPLHLANGAIVPHLLAGNPVIFKPSPVGAVVAAQYAAIFQRHLPPGVFGLVQGQAEEGMALCTDTRVRSICFTGSVAVGRAIAQAVAADFSKSLALELGGKNALILLDDGDPVAAAQSAAEGLCVTAGQRCNGTSRVILTRNQVDAFLAALRPALDRFAPGDPGQPETTLGVLVNEAAHRRYAQIVSNGGEWVVPGAALGSWEGRPGYYVRPAVRLWRDLASGLRCPTLAQEVFAPLLDVFVAESDAEIRTLHDAAPFGLTASIYTASRARFEDLGTDLAVGNLYANLPTTYSPSLLPFGGCGLSGNGKPAGRGFIRFTADEQAVQFGPGLH